MTTISRYVRPSDVAYPPPLGYLLHHEPAAFNTFLWTMHLRGTEIWRHHDPLALIEADGTHPSHGCPVAYTDAAQAAWTEWLENPGPEFVQRNGRLPVPSLWVWRAANLDFPPLVPMGHPLCHYPVSGPRAAARLIHDLATADASHADETVGDSLFGLTALDLDLRQAREWTDGHGYRITAFDQNFSLARKPSRNDP